MPTGKVRAGTARVAGITTTEILLKLDFMVLERDLRSRSQALGVALAEWDSCCGKRVSPSDQPSRPVPTASTTSEGVVDPADANQEGA
jgi:hypothetical protein